MKQEFLVKSSPDTISIKADPVIIDELIRVLESVLIIAHEIKRKVKYESDIAREKREKEAALRTAQFQAEAINIYKRYQEHLNSGCHGSKSLAIQKIKQEFSMGYTDADIYIAEGRKALRERKKASTPCKC